MLLTIISKIIESDNYGLYEEWVMVICKKCQCAASKLLEHKYPTQV